MYLIVNRWLLLDVPVLFLTRWLGRPNQRFIMVMILVSMVRLLLFYFAVFDLFMCQSVSSGRKLLFDSKFSCDIN